MARGDLPPGTTLGGYRIHEVLGRGGMGVVYRAEDPRGRTVALKVVARAIAADDGFMTRFRREGRAASAVAHENVVALLDSGEDGGLPFLVFEHVGGGTLKEKLKRAGRLEWREASALGAGIARGLAA